MFRRVPPAERTAHPSLVRAIGPFTLAASAVNCVVGAGIFALPALVAARLGPAAVLAYVLCGALVALVLTCFAEVGSQVTRSGGAIAYVEEAFGPLAGWLTWVALAVCWNVAADAAIAHVMLDALASFAPALRGGVVRALAIVALFAALAAINVAGVRQGARLVVATTLAKLAPLALLVVAGAFAIDARNLAWTAWPSASALGAASLVLFFAFAGAESALTASGEIDEPARTVPRGLLAAVLTLVALFVSLQATAQGVLGDALATSSDAPLAALAERLAGPVGRSGIVVATALAVFGAIAGDMVGVPRAFLAAAESGLLPSALRRVHPRHRTPWVAIVTFAALTTALALTGSFAPLAVLSSVSLLLVYLGVALAALRLRGRPRPPGAFRAPGGPLVPVLAAGAVLWLLAQSTRREAATMAAVLTAAAAYYAVRTRATRRLVVRTVPTD